MPQKSKLSDIAEKAGVSVPCVSRVLNNSGYVSEEKRERVLRALEELEYIHNVRMRKNSDVVALMLPVGSSMVYQTLLDCFVQEAQKRDKLVITCTDLANNESVKAFLRRIHRMDADGIAISAFADKEMSAELADAIAASKSPVVLLERDGGLQDANKIMINSIDGIYQATQYLIDIGHRRIGFIGVVTELEEERRRCEGFRQAMRDRGLPVNEDHVVLMPGYEAGYGRNAMHSILTSENPPTAMVTGADHFACGALYALNERGMSVPEDMSIVSYDNELSAYLYPAVTSVQPPFREMAAVALDMIEEGMRAAKKYRTVYLSPSLVHRHSTKPR